MGSLRFSFFSFPPPQNSNVASPSSPRRSSFSSTAAASSAAVACTAVGAGITINKTSRKNPFVGNTINSILSHFPLNNLKPYSSSSSSRFWASLSGSFGDRPDAEKEPKTGASFPKVLKDSQKLLGIGLRTKSAFWKTDAYAFGVYANEDDVVKNLAEKYGKCSASELKENKEFNEDILASDLDLTIRLQIVNDKLSIRNAFEESLGSRLQNLGGPNKELLQRFTSQFKDEAKLPKGTVIEFSREHGYILRTRIDGKELGSIKSKLLCQSVLDIYIGKDPVDQQAKENVMQELANALERHVPIDYVNGD